MIFTTSKELSLRGLNINSLEIELNNRIFSRGPDFSKKIRHVALSFCDKYPQGACMIVEDKHYYTIWVEKSVQEINKSQKNQAPYIKETIATDVLVDNDFKQICQKELTQFIGPIAGIICSKTYQENPSISKTDFVTTLAAKIPDTQQAKLFKQKLLVLIN